MFDDRVFVYWEIASEAEAYAAWTWFTWPCSVVMEEDDERKIK